MQRYQWVKKLQFEKENWEYSYFITLTYSNDNVPSELKVKDVQNFIKYLRFELKQPLRYFATGEYGSKTKRPHYHLILFTDYKLELNWLKDTKNGSLYDCKLLNKCWKNQGFIWTAYDYDNKSFAYCSSYSCKEMTKQFKNINAKMIKKNIDDLKINNPDLSGLEKYLLIDNLIQSIDNRKAEFIIMSKNPPIGSNKRINETTPSSLCKWHRDKIDKEKYLFWDKLSDVNYNNEWSDLLIKRQKNYYEFIENNDIYGMIQNNILLYDKRNEKNKKQ